MLDKVEVQCQWVYQNGLVVSTQPIYLEGFLSFYTIYTIIFNFFVIVAYFNFAELLLFVHLKVIVIFKKIWQN